MKLHPRWEKSYKFTLQAYLHALNNYLKANPQCSICATLLYPVEAFYKLSGEIYFYFINA